MLFFFSDFSHLFDFFIGFSIIKPCYLELMIFILLPTYIFWIGFKKHKKSVYHSEVIRINNVYVFYFIVLQKLPHIVTSLLTVFCV